MATDPKIEIENALRLLRLVLGGRLAVDSRPGAGTRLVVELPCGS